MEAAIPGHLRVGNPRPKQVEDDFRPAYPSYVARFQPGVRQVVMAYFGIQYSGEPPKGVGEALGWLAKAFDGLDGPKHWDRARYTDEASFINIISVAYWDDVTAFDGWFRAVRDGWTGVGSVSDAFGNFIEVLRPSVEGYETLFSSLDRPEGIAALADGMSGEIQEHAYWGGMRDRLPRAQSSALAAEASPHVVRSGNRVQVVPQDNLCLIRSGQDWTDTDTGERKKYLEEVEPHLREGMDFLRDEGLSIGCFANRYMTVLSDGGQATEKSYGMSWWKDLSALEAWAKSHPTHVKIFGAAMKYLSELGPTAKLKLYHEVTVARADEQFFEYRNCHSRTGLLKIHNI